MSLFCFPPFGFDVGIAQMQQGLVFFQAAGADLGRLDDFPQLAAAYAKGGQIEGLTVLAEGLALVEKTGARSGEAELYRLKDELTLAQSKVQSLESRVLNRQSPTPNAQAEVERKAEECFLKAIDITRQQSAKSLELRAVMSLVRLRQHQAAQHASRITQHKARTRLAEAHQMLAAIYNWFTEGFDTKGLQDAQCLLDELAV